MENEIHELFIEVDDDRNGYIDKREMQVLLQKIGIPVDEY